MNIQLRSRKLVAVANKLASLLASIYILLGRLNLVAWNEGINKNYNKI